MRSSKIMMGRMRMVTVAAVLVVASGIGVADAQQGMPGMMQGGGMSMGHEGMGHEGIMMMCRMAEHVEGRLAYLKTELKITEAQMPAMECLRRYIPRHRTKNGATLRDGEGARRRDDVRRPT